MTIAPATFRVAEPERRFRAFVVDRAIAWTLFALAAVAAWWWFFRDDKIGAGIGLIVAVVVVVSLVFAVLLGRFGSSPGRAAFGLRVVNAETGDPIGIGPALVRTTVVGVGSLPMFGLGLATLAWTAVDDHTGERRGWHDHVARSVVLDIRPVAVREELADDRPRHVVNLTAMRLMPVKEAEPPVVPAPVQGRTGPHQTGPQSGTPSGPEPRSREQRPSAPTASGRAEPGQPPAGDAATSGQSGPTGSPAQSPPAQSPPDPAQQPRWAPPGQLPPQPPGHGETPPDHGHPGQAQSGQAQSGQAQFGQGHPGQDRPNQEQSAPSQSAPSQSPGRPTGPVPEQPGPERGPQVGQGWPPPQQRPAPQGPRASQPGPMTHMRPAAGRHSGPTTGGGSSRPAAPLPKWRIIFDSGESFVVEGLGLVGRQPQGRQGEPVRHVVPLASADMSISKTHAQFHLAADGALVVTDRGSTNGSLLIRRGVTRELSSGRPATLVDGDRVRVGDREMRVAKEDS